MKKKKLRAIYERIGGNLNFAEIPPKREGVNGNCEEAGVPRAV